VTSAAETYNHRRQGEQLTFADLAAKPKPTPAVPANDRLAMFTKPALFAGKAGPTRFDPEHDEDLRGGL